MTETKTPYSVCPKRLLLELKTSYKQVHRECCGGNANWCLLVKGHFPWDSSYQCGVGELLALAVVHLQLPLGFSARPHVPTFPLGTGNDGKSI